MAKVIILTIAAIIIAMVAILAVTAVISWAWALFNADRQAIRDETREARWAREDLEDAVERQTRRKGKK